MAQICGAACRWLNSSAACALAAHALPCAACVSAALRRDHASLGRSLVCGGFSYPALLSPHKKKKPDATPTAGPPPSEKGGTAPPIPEPQKTAPNKEREIKTRPAATRA